MNLHIKLRDLYIKLNLSVKCILLKIAKATLGNFKAILEESHNPANGPSTMEKGDLVKTTNHGNELKLFYFAFVFMTEHTTHIPNAVPMIKRENVLQHTNRYMIYHTTDILSASK